MKRRDFLKNTGLSTGSILAAGSIATFFASCKKTMDMTMNMDMGSATPVTEGNFARLLPIPATVGGNTSLAAQAATGNINGTNISVLGYTSNGILGPTIRINNGATANISFQNKLAENTNVHWHGLKIPAAMDGHPANIISAGSSFNFQFNINQRAALNWYHPHAEGTTAKQAFQGLAGMFIINDAEEAALNLPSGDYEIPLVIQDKRLSSSGITYNPTMDEVMTGFMGDTITVNGVASPYTEVSTRFYRLRILNGSNGRIYNLALSNNADLIVIGNDGGLLKNPVAVKTILLSPGERLDVLVNFAGISTGTDVYLENRMFEGAGDAQGKQAFKIIKFKVTQSVTKNFTVPSTLSSITAIPASAAAQTRTFTFDMMQMSSGMNMSGMHLINNKAFDKMRIDADVKANTTEVWTFDNSAGDEPHPMHLHGVHFQVLERTGGRGQLIASEGGWKDTVLVLPKEKVKIVIPFASLTGTFVFHCHNLEHEEDGMMAQYRLS